MEHNGRYMLDTNYRCSKDLLDACQAQGTRLLYASSAATYGGSASFREEPAFEQPLNVYGYSKLLFDNVVRRMLPQATAAGGGLPLLQRLRPARAAQGPHGLGGLPPLQPVPRDRQVKLFGEYGGYGPGEQTRDFVFVDDVVAVNLWFLQNPSRAASSTSAPAARSRSTTSRWPRSTPRARCSGEPALPLSELVAQGLVEYIEFPHALVGKYQCFTQADLARLRATGCDHAFADVADRREALRRLAGRLAP
jgi:ADP-L-glycero-D-manno-heptose 6-epimerase